MTVVTAMSLAACGGGEQPAPARQAISTDPLPTEYYAGDVVFAFSDTIPTDARALPIRAYIGLTAEADTRLGIKAAVDLREIQRELPSLISGRIDPECGLGLDIHLVDARAQGETVGAQGTVRAELYRCRGSQGDARRRGARLWTQVIDFDAQIGARLAGECVGFDLRALELDPRGFFGGLGTFLGITEKVRRAILERGNATLEDAPVCPELPDALALLAADFTTGGPVEVGEGGMGAALAGTLATDATRLVGLLRHWQGKDILPRPGEKMVVPEGAVAFRFKEMLKDIDPPAAYTLDLAMRPASPRRIGITAQLDLSEFQQRLPALAAGALLVDECRMRVELLNLETRAQAENLVALARLDARSFTCERTGEGAWQRGALERSEDVDVRAEVTASVDGACVIFQLVDLARDPPLAVIAEGRLGSRTEAVRTLFISEVDKVLKNHPLCPELPEELLLLDPHFLSGGPTEIGSGALGFRLEGSIDLSAVTIIAVLQLLQERGSLPPRR